MRFNTLLSIVRRGGRRHPCQDATHGRRPGAPLKRPPLTAAAIALSVAAFPPVPGGGATRAHGVPDPLAGAPLRAFLRTRAGDITAAVYDLATRQLFVYRPGVHEDEASIAKVDILATRLYEDRRDGATLSAADADAAAEAIEDSDNDAAQALWDADGGNPAIAAFNAAVGMRSTILDPEGVWGHYETTAADQLALLAHLALPNAQLTSASRDYELGLMRRVAPSQAWGVSAGVLAPATVALKNGWSVPSNETGWQVNSVGFVSGRHRDYLIAVLTDADPSMAYGVATIEGISRIVWKALLPARFRAPDGRPARRGRAPSMPGGGPATRAGASGAA